MHYLYIHRFKVRHVPGEKRGYRPRQLLQEARQDTMRAKSSSPLVPTPEEDDMSGKSARFGSGSPIQRKPLPVHEPKPNLQVILFATSKELLQERPTQIFAYYVLYTVGGMLTNPVPPQKLK